MGQITTAVDYSTVANTIKIAVDGPSNYDGFAVFVKVANTVTGASTLTVSNKTAVPVKKQNDNALIAGDIEAGQWALFTYNLADNAYEMLSVSAIPSSASGDMLLGTAQTVTAAKTFNALTLLMRNVANTFSSYFTNTNTAARVYTLKDADGTIAFTSDITGTNSGTNTGDQSGGDATNNIGYLNIPQNSQSADYTTVLADSGKCLFHPVADNNIRTFTIDSNANVAYPIGTVIAFKNNAAAALSIAITSDTLTLDGTGTTGTRTLAQFGKATAIKETATSWSIGGINLS